MQISGSQIWYPANKMTRYPANKMSRKFGSTSRKIFPVGDNGGRGPFIWA